jgi:hypothetical protein
MAHRRKDFFAFVGLRGVDFFAVMLPSLIWNFFGYIRGEPDNGHFTPFYASYNAIYYATA